MHWIQFSSMQKLQSELFYNIKIFILPPNLDGSQSKKRTRINNIHERTLRLIYPSDSKSTFKEPLDKIKTVSIHLKNLRVLATEIFKAKLNISPELLKELFSLNVRTNKFRNQSTLKRIKTNYVNFAGESLSSLAPKIWDLLPDSFKNEKSLERFKIG